MILKNAIPKQNCLKVQKQVLVHAKLRERGRFINIISSESARDVDRTEVPDKKGKFVIAEKAISLEYDIKQANINSINFRQKKFLSVTGDSQILLVAELPFSANHAICKALNKLQIKYWDAL